jgi:hypothetical protein
MKADMDAVIEAFRKNEHVKIVFWTFFIAMAGLVPARVVDPVTAQQIVGMIYGVGGVKGPEFAKISSISRSFFQIDCQQTSKPLLYCNFGPCSLARLTILTTRNTCNR